MDMLAVVLAIRLARRDMESALPHAEVVPPSDRWPRLRAAARRLRPHPGRPGDRGGSHRSLS
ncbi:hypothetical protein AB0F81_14065 [Actinoplanes sp. NPDC024001]|uniref:hypothetical protein n=1 Tax=Actinoplanes sp. NPDC024001 TaxID=3154598 RepID=UPI0033DC8235